MITLRRLKDCLILCLAIAPLTAMAQNAWVGMPVMENAIRNSQLLGLTTENVSHCIRPIHLNHAFEWEAGLYEMTYALPESEYEPMGYAEWVDGRVAIALLPGHLTAQYNQHHPYGWSDGPMVPNKGVQLFGSGGLYARVGPLEIQLMPEYVYGSNDSFEPPPARASNIDNPERMGTLPFNYLGKGQSYAKLNFKQVGIGISNENLWWGPGQKSAILMSNNAPGFTHGTLHTTKPLETKVGSFEMQMVGGMLQSSGLYPYPTAYDDSWPPRLAPIKVDTSWVETEWKYLNGLVVNYQPKWLPGLHVGFVRSVMYGSDDLDSWKDYVQAFLPVLKVTTGEDGSAKNQLMSGYFRYVLPESHAEVYAEYAREDAAWDLEDLLTEPEHTRAYMMGFRKLQPLGKEDHEYLEVMAEFTQIQQGFSLISRAKGYSFYTHSLIGGYTHQGQVLGAGIGPGGNLQTAGLTYRNQLQALGFHLERYVHNNDLFYTRLPYLWLGGDQYHLDATKHWVDVSGTISYSDSYGPWLFEAKLQGVQTYNFNWRYATDGDPGVFRYPGMNMFHFNASVRSLYRF